MAIDSTAARADDVVERIDDGDLDPSEVDIRPFVEHDDAVLTPELAERLPDEKVEQYNQRVAERDERDLRQAKRERSEEQQELLEQLETVVDEDEPTATVEIGEITAEVTTKLSGKLEDNIDEISRLEDEERPGAISQARDLLIETCIMLVVDDDTEGLWDLQTWEAWEAYYRKHGSEGLIEAFMTLADPALERRENLKNSRRGRRGR